MLLSIVIVNYNVKYFLEQCLESVYNSNLALHEAPGEELQLEVFVVDNASVDGSVEMVREKYPQVHLIANQANVGFARANNQALRQCRGDLMLLLNPDTVVEHDTFSKCADFYATHPDCGGLAVKMINGEGTYLKESKRGFPTPAASFYKMSGLVRLFPHSRRIAAYYMGHLSDDETNPVDILPGAYLMISRKALEKVGLLDESYFMYGEDIDFSWRIKLAGFENYYFPETRIIHYKGESTKRGSMNYVYTFYNAMSIFVKRYFSGRNAKFFNLLLHLAIWGRFCGGLHGFLGAEAAVGNLLGFQCELLSAPVHVAGHSAVYRIADAMQLALRRLPEAGEGHAHSKGHGGGHRHAAGVLLVAQREPALLARPAAVGVRMDVGFLTGHPRPAEPAAPAGAPLSRRADDRAGRRQQAGAPRFPEGGKPGPRHNRPADHP